MTTLAAKRIYLADEAAEALLHRVAALGAAGDALEKFTEHVHQSEDDGCLEGLCQCADEDVDACAELDGPCVNASPCTCGLSSALSAWREARG
jgi:predicted TIM-barrel fold metal-dependent hydrolase